MMMMISKQPARLMSRTKSTTTRIVGFVSRQQQQHHQPKSPRGATLLQEPLSSYLSSSSSSSILLFNNNNGDEQYHRKQHHLQRRMFSSANNKSTESTYSSTSSSTSDIATASTSSEETTCSPSSSSVDETLDRLFKEQEPQAMSVSSNSASSNLDSLVSSAGTATTDGVIDAATATGTWDPVWWNSSDQILLVMNEIHKYTDLQYGYVIIGFTVAIRCLLFPMMISAQRSASRMAHVRPELDELRKKFNLIGNPTRQDQLNFGVKMNALFKRYEISPMLAFLPPLIQIPIVISLYFALQKMPNLGTTFTTDLQTGGFLWFIDLTQPDPTYILPIITSASFYGMLEMSKSQMSAGTSPEQQQQQKMMINVFRAVTVFMIPVTCQFHTAMLCYWVPNNMLTILQTYALHQPAVRRYYGIWEPPKPIPGTEEEQFSFKDSMTKVYKRISGNPDLTIEQKMKKHNDAIDAQKRTDEMLSLRGMSTTTTTASSTTANTSSSSSNSNRSRRKNKAMARGGGGGVTRRRR